MDKRIKETNIIEYGYNHLEPGHPDNPKPFRICGAHTTSENARGDICTLPAGYDTWHKGAGRCKWHGGSALSGPDNPNWKGGRYAHIFKGRLAEYFKNVHQDESNPLDLMPELEAQRVLFVMALDRLADSPIQPAPGAHVTDGKTKEVGREVNELDNKLDGMGVGGGGSGFVSVEPRVDIPPSQFSTVPPEKDLSKLPPSAMRLVREEDMQIARDFGKDIVETVGKIIAMRNQTAMTKAEIVWLIGGMRELIELFVPKDQREAAINFLRDKLPVVKDTAEEDIG